MKYKVIGQFGFSLGGGKDVKPGDVIELEPKQATHHVELGRIAPYTEKSAPQTPAVPEKEPEGKPKGK